MNKKRLKRLENQVSALADVVLSIAAAKFFGDTVASVRADDVASVRADDVAVSLRGNQWREFSDKVFDHIENYTVPQYGDAPDDNVESWSFAQCIGQVGKYAARAGTNAREGQEKLDLLKIAHYACLAYQKLDK